jgi:saccharopine dehydrogenase-like NADP-dependent oxidoreductase
MSGEMAYNSDLVTRMLQEAFTFDGKFDRAEFSCFRNGFVLTVNEFAREMGYVNREQMMEQLKSCSPDDLLRQIQEINSQLKEKSRTQMARVVELHFNKEGKDQSIRSFLQIMLQKLRKGIQTAENEVSRMIAEILYGIVTLATLRI